MTGHKKHAKEDPVRDLKRELRPAILTHLLNGDPHTALRNLKARDS